MTLANARVLKIALVASVVALMVPTPAAAAPERAGEIQVSADGVTFHSHYPGSLFDGIAHLVPGDTDAKLFYLRNTGDAPGFLSLTLRDVVSTNTDFSHALTVSASSPGYTGEPVTVGSVDPCWVLLERQRVEPGETLGVTANLALGNLDGRAGQGATAGMVIRAVLSDTSIGLLSPTDCGGGGGGGGTDISVLPGSDSGAPAGTSISGDPSPDQSTTSPEGNPTQGGDLPVLNLPGGIVIDPNTWHLYEEFLVLILFASAVMGAGWFLVVARRRRNREGEAETDVTA